MYTSGENGQHPLGWREPSRRLPIFVAVSVLLHGALVVWNHDQASPTVVSNSIGSPLVASLIQPRPADHPAKPVATISKKATPEMRTERKPILKTPHAAETFVAEATPPRATSTQAQSPPAAPMAVSGSVQDNVAVASKAQQAQQAQQENYLLGEIRNRLSHYLLYPPQALRRGWEGEVLVAFWVDEQGRLGNIHLTRSSGYSLLDESALAALGRINQVPLDESLLWQPMEVQLPVRYQLRAG